MSGITDTISTKTLGTTEVVVIKRFGDGSYEFAPKLVTTGTTTNTSPTITAVVSTNGVVVGQQLTCTGFTGTVRVVSFVANTSITVDQNAASSGSGRTVTVQKTKFDIPSRKIIGSCNETVERAFLDALLAVV